MSDKRSFSRNSKVVVENSGLALLVWFLAYVLFWDFDAYGIDLYDAMMQALTF